MGCSFGDLGIGKERAASDLDIRNHVVATGDAPLEGERIDTDTVRRVRFLNYQEDGTASMRTLSGRAGNRGRVAQ